MQCNALGGNALGVHVVTLVVYGDDDPAWCPTAFEASRWGCERKLTFPPVKLLGYAQQLETLEADRNPFALLTLAHLQALFTRKNPEERAGWKKRLLLGLYNRELDAEDMRHWYKLLDWLLDLPEELDKQVWEAVTRFEEEHKMTHVTFAERYGMQKMTPLVHQSIEVALRAKFGAVEEPLVQKVRDETDPDRLQKVVQALGSDATLDEIRQLLS